MHLTNQFLWEGFSWGGSIPARCSVVIMWKKNAYNGSYYTEDKWSLTLTLLTWRIWWTPNNASRWQMEFNSAFKRLILLFMCVYYYVYVFLLYVYVSSPCKLAFFGYSDWGFPVHFPQLQGKFQCKTRKDGARPTLFQNFCVLCIVCFVSFCVLCVSKWVLYYCYRVAIQLQLTNILYIIISYHHIIYHNISDHISYHIVSSHIIFQLISYIIS